MPRDADVYLQDILTAIGRIQDFTHGMSLTAFRGDARTIDAVLEVSREFSGGHHVVKHAQGEHSRIAVHSNTG